MISKQSNIYIIGTTYNNTERVKLSYVRTKEIPPGSGRHYRYLQRSYREGDQVKTETVKYLGPAGGKNDTSFEQSEIPEKYQGELGTTEKKGKISVDENSEAFKEGYEDDLDKYDTEEILDESMEEAKEEEDKEYLNYLAGKKKQLKEKKKTKSKTIKYVEGGGKEVEYKIKEGKGNYKGAMGKPSYIARVNGTNRRYGMDREFVDPSETEMERNRHGNIKGKGIAKHTYKLDNGLYEVKEYGKKSYITVTDGNKKKISEKKAKKLAEEIEEESGR